MPTTIERPGSPTDRVFAAAVLEKVPVMFIGDPGIGKSAKINAFGAAWNFHVETVNMGTREAADFLGLPIVVDGEDESPSGSALKAPAKKGNWFTRWLTRSRTVHTPPGWALNANAAVEHGHVGAIVFLDEASTASPSVWKGGLRLTQERVAGELPLADHVALVAAMNPPEQAADGWDLAAPAANRFCHLPWDFDADEWAHGLMTDFTQVWVPTLEDLTTRGTEQDRSRANLLVAGFIQHHQHLLRPGPPKDETKAGQAWASPRSWHNAARLLSRIHPGDEDAMFLAVKGCVGEGPAKAFIAWTRTADLPDPAKVIADPASVEWASIRADKAFVIVHSVAAYATLRTEKKIWDGALRALTLCAEAGRADVALPAARILLNRLPKGVEVHARTREAFRDIFERTGRWAA